MKDKKFQVHKVNLSFMIIAECCVPELVVVYNLNQKGEHLSKGVVLIEGREHAISLALVILPYASFPGRNCFIDGDKSFISQLSFQLIWHTDIIISIEVTNIDFSLCNEKPSTKIFQLCTISRLEKNSASEWSVLETEFENTLLTC